MSNGDVWTATISHDANDLTIVLQDGNAPFFTMVDPISNIATILGTTSVYAALSGGTGDAYEKQPWGCFASLANGHCGERRSYNY